MRTCHQLLESLLAARGVHVHSVTSRLKGRASLEEKLGRPEKHYRTLADVTDLVGLRVITHFEDEVDLVGKLIADEFLVDSQRSIESERRSRRTALAISQSTTFPD